MDSFAFIIHPLGIEDIYAWEKGARGKSVPLVEKMLEWAPPFKFSHITGIRSLTGKEIEGYFITCPVLPKQFFSWPEEKVVDKILKATEVAAGLGVDVVGLGALTAVVGDGGRKVIEAASLPVTTGNSYTVTTALQSVFKACELLEKDISSCTAAIVGGTGSIGAVCAQVLARETASVIVLGRDPDRLLSVRQRILDDPARRADVEASSDIDAALSRADIVITVTSAAGEVIVDPGVLKPGSVVCDVARPRDVSKLVAESRPDVLVIDGGVVEVPGEVSFGYDFGFPKGTSYACMAETMMLTLEGRFEAYSVGKDLSVSQYEETSAWAGKHGFRPAGFRCFERAVTAETIERVKSLSAQAV